MPLNKKLKFMEVSISKFQLNDANHQIESRRLTIRNIINLIEINNSLEIEMTDDFIADYFNVASVSKLENYLSFFYAPDSQILTLQMLRDLILSDTNSKLADTNHTTTKEAITDINHTKFEEFANKLIEPWTMLKCASVETIHQVLTRYKTKEEAYTALDVSISVFSKHLARKKISFSIITYFTAKQLADLLNDDIKQPLTPAIGEIITHTYILRSNNGLYSTTPTASLRVAPQPAQPLPITRLLPLRFHAENPEQKKPKANLTLTSIIEVINQYSYRGKISAGLISKSFTTTADSVRRFIRLFLDKNGKPINLAQLVKMTATNEYQTLISLSGKKYDDIKNASLSGTKEFKAAPLKNLYTAISHHSDRINNCDYHVYASDIGISKENFQQYFSDFNITCELILSFTAIELECILGDDFNERLSKETADLLNSIFKQRVNLQTNTSAQNAMDVRPSLPPIPAPLPPAIPLPPANHFTVNSYSPFDFFGSVSYAAPRFSEEEIASWNYLGYQP